MKINPEKDGITHINIYSKGRTELGRLLTNFAHTPVITEDGRFESLEGYWYWLLSEKNEESEFLRELYGWKAKQFGRELKIKDWPTSGEKIKFREKIEKAMRCKLDQHPNIKELLVSSTLPFAHYYCYYDKVIEVKNCKWILEIWELLRNEQ